VKRRSTAGVTLIEVLIAVTLLSLLVVGMAIAMRVGFNAFAKTDAKLMDNRRVAGAQRVLEQELEGMVPLVLPCLGAGPERVGEKFAFFQGDPQAMRLVSTFSLQQAWRGQPQVLELFVVPGADGRGVRLVVNESRYVPSAAGLLCTGFYADPVTQIGMTRYPQPVANARSFVLADKLAYCRFSYLQLDRTDFNKPPLWFPRMSFQGWPRAVRVDMAPLEADPSRLQPISVIAPLRVYRAAEIQYGEY